MSALLELQRRCGPRRAVDLDGLHARLGRLSPRRAATTAAHPIHLGFPDCSSALHAAPPARRWALDGEQLGAALAVACLPVLFWLLLFL